MADDPYRVFLSAVTDELGPARRAVAADLRARGLSVREQDDFTQHPDTTLHKLHDYIRDCNAVVCIIGRRDGAMPQPDAAAQFPGVLPAGIADASYTQWELFFARHFRRRLLRYIADDAFYPGDPPAWDVRQQALVRHIVETGQDRFQFASLGDLQANVLRQYWPETLTGKPIDLRYATLGSLFKGREAFLRRLRDGLHRGGGHAAIVGRAVHGLGGVGKTRAAIEYAWASLGDYTALLFIEAATPEALRRDVAALCDRLAPSVTALEQNVRFEAVVGWLNAHPGWLLILDNIDDLPALQAVERLIAQLQGGHVLLTGRFSGHPAGIQAFDLDVLETADAAAFLLERTEDHRRPAADDAAQARALAVEMDGLALALEIAGAFIEQRKCGFAQYLAPWRENRAKLMTWSNAATTPPGRTIDATWQTSVAHLTPAGRVLLERLAFFAPEPVPEFLLDAAVPGAGTEDLTAALDDLAAYSLAMRVTIALRYGEQPGFAVHRLVQDVTRRSLNATTARARLMEALGWVNAAFTGHPQDVRTWPRLDPLAPHARAVAAFADKAGIAAPTARLMNEVAQLLDAKALLAEAEPLMRRALSIDEASFGAAHPTVAIRLNNLAALLSATNRLAEAEPLMRRALSIDEASFGAAHPNVAIRLNNLAGVLQATNRLAEAEPLKRRALSIDEASFGADHPNVAIRLNNLAQLLHGTNRLAEAEPLMRRALSIDEASLGADHPDVARDVSNLAALLQDTNRLAEAEPLMRRALSIDEASFGAAHPTVAIRLNNLAALLRATNRLAEAEPLVRRALSVDEASFGADHPEVAIRLNNLAQLLQATNRLRDAEPLMRRALVIDEASFGADHPAVARDLNNLAQLLRVTNRLAEAEPLSRRHLAIFFAFEKQTGHAHPHRDAAIRNYTGLLQAMGRSKAEIREAIVAIRWKAGKAAGRK